MKSLLILKWLLAITATWGIWSIAWRDHPRYPVPVYINGGTIHVR